MHPIIIDSDTGNRLWRAADCADHCGVTTSTWHSYSRTGGTLHPPAPVARMGGSPLWDAGEVRTWHANRPGSPVPNHPTGRRP